MLLFLWQQALFSWETKSVLYLTNCIDILIIFSKTHTHTTVGVTASAFGLGATLSNYVGQMVVQEFDHVTSLMASMFLSLVPILIFSFMPETLGKRATTNQPPSPKKQATNDAVGKKGRFAEESPALTMSSSYGSTEDSSLASS